MSIEGFDNEISEDVALKYDTHSNIVSDVVGGAVATVGDFAASTFNSLVPERYETSTEDLLSKIDSNALRVYEENPDTIHTASFLGGMFVPTGLALKGLKAAREGMKGVNFFSEAGQIAQKTKVAEAFANAGVASKTYRQSLYGLYAMGAGNAIVDTVATEAALVIAMNAHPLMEDYMEDLPKNFLTSVALGAGVGGVFSAVIDRSTIKGIKMGVEREATDIARKGYKDVSDIENLSGQMTQRSRNVENWENILRSANSISDKVEQVGPVRDINLLTKELLNTLVVKEKAEISDMFEKMISPEMREFPESVKGFIRDKITNNPDMFGGIDSIKFAKASENLPEISSKASSLTESTKIKPAKIGEMPQELELPLTQTNSKGKDVAVTMVYSPVYDAFMLSKDMKHYGTAVDLIQDSKKLTEGLDNNWFRVPRYDQSLINDTLSTAAIDADYLKTLKYYDELPIEEFFKGSIAIAPDDSSTLSAVYARLSKEGLKDPDVYAKFKATITKELPDYSKSNTEVIEKIITNTITRTVTLGETGQVVKGISKNALNDMTSFLRGSEGPSMDLMREGNSLSKEARALANSFSKDQMWPLHNGLEIARRHNDIPQALLNEEQALRWGSDSYKEMRRIGLSHKEAMDGYKPIVADRAGKVGHVSISYYGADEWEKLGVPLAAKIRRDRLYDVAMEEGVGKQTSNLGKYAMELMNSPETKKLKNTLAKSADSEGYIYLYRGMRGKAAGHSPGESYTPDYKIALAFAGQDPKGVSLYRVHLDEVVGHLGSYGSSVGGEAEIVLDVPTRAVGNAGKTEVITGKQANGHTVTEIMSGQDIKTLVKKGAGKEENVVDSMGVFNKLLENKQAMMDSQLAMGIPMETIALHANVPIETVEAYATSATKYLITLNKPLTKYTSASEIDKYLDINNRALSVSTNMNKVPAARIKAQLSTMMSNTIDADVKTAMFLGSSSNIMRESGKFLGSDTVSAQMAVLRSEFNKIVDSSVNSKFLTSSDFALRDLGALGAVITALGKDVNEMVNKRVIEMWEPMKGHFTSISKDPAAIVELNTAMKVNASIEGYREYKAGQFLKQDANKPWNEILDPNTGKVISKERNMIPVEYKGSIFTIQTPSVQMAFKEMNLAGRELFEMRNTLNKVSGRAPMNDIGFWAPPFNPRGKNISYVWDKVENKTTLLFGKNAEELKTAENAFISTLPQGDLGRRYEIIRKGQQEEFNKIQGRTDTAHMTSADSSMFHSGSSAPEIVSTNADVLVDIANGYDHYIGYGVRSMMDLHLNDVMDKLDQISYISQASFKDQPLGFIQKMIQKPKDPGAIIKNTIMGNSNLDQSIFWEKLSDVSGGAAEFALTAINNLVEPILNTGKNFFGKGKVASDEALNNLTKSLDARGIPNPFAAMDEHLAKEVFHVQQISQAPNMTPRILALSNALSATMMLRFMEVAQPICNMISLPILTSGAMGRKLEKSFMDGALDPNARFGVIKTMYNGARFGGSAEGRILLKEATETGIFKSLVSEATEVMSQARNLNSGIITKVEQGLESNLVKILSKPADLTETLVRKQAFLTGAYMAKEAYPGISKAGIMTFARDFVDQAVGNYSSAQRPIMFQGTLGVAAGLFQTYMLTMAQDIYRMVEIKNFKGLGKMMLAQSTIFGAKSLPGFNYVSDMIGEHFSDQNIDLTTGTYRAVEDNLANTILYGLPSNLGPSFTSRGDVAPRIPDFLTKGVTAIPSFNILSQALQAGNRVAEAAMTTDASTGKALLEALSLQSVSRPIARMSELLSGHSITSKGNVVSNPDDVWTWTSAASRAMATRPLEEVKSREAIRLNTMYGSLDQEARSSVVKELRTHIRAGTLTPEIVEEIGGEYMKTGSAAGFRAAINQSIAQTQTSSGNTVRNYLKPNSPYLMMINDLE